MLKASLSISERSELGFGPAFQNWKIIDKIPMGQANAGVFTKTVWKVMFVEIFRLTNSIWPAVLLHAVKDAVINPLVINGHISIASGMEIFI